MAENTYYLHHCERCSAVFSAPSKGGVKIVCSACGESPALEASPFVARAKAETVVDSDQLHGVPGKDLADFVSMQKARRRKQMRMALCLWCFLLVSVPVTLFYFNTQRVDSLADKAKLGAGKEAARIEAYQSVSDALVVFDKYMQADDAIEGSAFVVGGVRQIIKMREDSENLAAVRLKADAQLLEARYKPVGEYPRVEGELEDPSGKKFEIVLWKVKGEWKVDWEQCVRYSDVNLEAFLAAKELGRSAEFRLLVRRRYSASVKPGQDLQLLFYQPGAVVGERSVESPQVDLTSQEPLHRILSEQFEALKIRQKDTDQLIAQDDGPGLLRVRARLSFVAGSEGQPVLQLDAVDAFHWMAFDPAKRVVSE